MFRYNLHASAPTPFANPSAKHKNWPSRSRETVTSMPVKADIHLSWLLNFLLMSLFLKFFKLYNTSLTCASMGDSNLRVRCEKNWKFMLLWHCMWFVYIFFCKNGQCTKKYEENIKIKIAYHQFAGIPGLNSGYHRFSQLSLVYCMLKFSF